MIHMSEMTFKIDITIYKYKTSKISISICDTIYKINYEY